MCSIFCDDVDSHEPTSGLGILHRRSLRFITRVGGYRHHSHPVPFRSKHPSCRVPPKEKVAHLTAARLAQRSITAPMLPGLQCSSDARGLVTLGACSRCDPDRWPANCPAVRALRNRCVSPEYRGSHYSINLPKFWKGAQICCTDQSACFQKVCRTRN